MSKIGPEYRSDAPIIHTFQYEFLQLKLQQIFPQLIDQCQVFAKKIYVPNKHKGKKQKSIS